MADDSHIQPRLLSGKAAAAYCGVTLNTFSKWVAAGIVPAPLPGTRRWDRKAIDLTLDKLSGIETLAVLPEEDSPLEKWMREDAARQVLSAEVEWERKYETRKKR